MRQRGGGWWVLEWRNARLGLPNGLLHPGRACILNGDRVVMYV